MTGALFRPPTTFVNSMQVALKAGVSFLDTKLAVPVTSLRSDDGCDGLLGVEAAAAADFLAASGETIRWGLFLDNPWFKTPPPPSTPPPRNKDGSIAKVSTCGEGFLATLFCVVTSSERIQLMI